MTVVGGPELAALARKAVDEWGHRGHVRAILVRGSAGADGFVPLGGDLDLLVVTDCPPADDRVRELRVDGVPIEVFVRDEASLTDVAEILRHQSLPFELAQNLHLDDRHGVLARCREAVRGRLLDREFVLARAQASQSAANGAFGQASAALGASRFEAAARHLSICLWHGATAAAAAAGMRPTSRRCLALWARAAERIGLPGHVDLIQAGLGPVLTDVELSRLADLLRPGDDRVVAAVEGMAQANEGRWAAYPLLRSALWPPMAERHSRETRAAVLSRLAWGQDRLRDRAAAGRDLIASLEDLISRGMSALDHRGDVR